MKDISVLEAVGLNPKPISIVITALFILIFVLGIRLTVEGLAKGHKHPSVLQGQSVVGWLVIAIIALSLLATPLVPATR